MERFFWVSVIVATVYLIRYAYKYYFLPGSRAATHLIRYAYKGHLLPAIEKGKAMEAADKDHHKDHN